VSLKELAFLLITGQAGEVRINLIAFTFMILTALMENIFFRILPEQLISIKTLDKVFNPADYVTWAPIQWFISRDWGEYS
jgi:hypothetical protein